MPLGDRIRRRRRRKVRKGDTFTIDEERANSIELEEVPADPEPQTPGCEPWLHGDLGHDQWLPRGPGYDAEAERQGREYRRGAS